MTDWVIEYGRMVLRHPVKPQATLVRKTKEGVKAGRTNVFGTLREPQNCILLENLFAFHL